MALGSINAKRSSATAYPPRNFLDFRGGMVDADPDWKIADNELSLSDNWMVDKDTGNLIKRHGLASSATLTAKPVGMYSGQNGNYIAVGGAISNLSGTVLHSGLVNPSHVSWASLGAYDVMVNGTDAVFTSNGSTWSDMRTGATNPMPAGVKYIVEYNNFIFAFGHDGPKVQWSSLGDATEWPTGQSWDLTENKWSPTGLRVWNGVCWAFFERSIFGLAGTVARSIQIPYQNNQAGASSNESIVSTPNGLYWWSNDFALVGIADPGGTEILFPAMRKVPKLMGLRNKAKDDLVHGIWNPEEERLEYWYCGPGSSTPNKLLYYYPKYDACYPGSGTAAEQLTSLVVHTANSQTVYSAGSLSGFLLDTDSLDVATLGTSTLYTQSGNDDAGVPIVATLQMKRDGDIDLSQISLSGPTTQKRARAVTTWIMPAGEGNATLSVYYDNNRVADVEVAVPLSNPPGFLLDTDSLDVGVLGGDLELESTEVHLRQTWKRIKLGWTDSLPRRNQFAGFTHEGTVWNA